MCADGSPRPLGMLHPAAVSKSADHTHPDGGPSPLTKHPQIPGPLQTPSSFHRASLKATPGTQSSQCSPRQQGPSANRPLSPGRRPAVHASTPGTQHQARKTSRTNAAEGQTESSGQAGSSGQSAWTACGPHFSQIHQLGSAERQQQHEQAGHDDSAWGWDSPTHRGSVPTPSFSGSFQFNPDMCHEDAGCQEPSHPGSQSAHRMHCYEHDRQSDAADQEMPSALDLQQHASQSALQEAKHSADQYDQQAATSEGGMSPREGVQQSPAAGIGREAIPEQTRAKHPASGHEPVAPGLSRGLSRLRQERKLHPSLSMQTQADDPGARPVLRRLEHPQQPAAKSSIRPRSAKPVRSKSPHAMSARPGSAQNASSRISPRRLPHGSGMQTPSAERKYISHGVPDALSSHKGSSQTRSPHGQDSRHQAAETIADQDQDHEPVGTSTDRPVSHSPSRIPKPFGHAGTMHQVRQTGPAKPASELTQPSKARPDITWVATPASRIRSTGSFADISGQPHGHQHVQKHTAARPQAAAAAAAEGDLAGQAAANPEGLAYGAFHEARQRAAEACASIADERPERNDWVAQTGTGNMYSGQAEQEPIQEWPESPEGAQDSSHSSGTCWPAEATSPGASSCHAPTPNQHADSFQHMEDSQSMCDASQQDFLAGRDVALNPELTFAPGQLRPAPSNAHTLDKAGCMSPSTASIESSAQLDVHVQPDMHAKAAPWQLNEPTQAGAQHAGSWTGELHPTVSHVPAELLKEEPSADSLVYSSPLSGSSTAPQDMHSTSIYPSPLADSSMGASSCLHAAPESSRGRANRIRQRQWWLNNPRFGGTMDMPLPAVSEQDVHQDIYSRAHGSKYLQQDPVLGEHLHGLRPVGLDCSSPPASSSCSGQEEHAHLQHNPSHGNFGEACYASPRGGTVKLGFPWSPELWRRMGPSDPLQPRNRESMVSQHLIGAHRTRVCHPGHCYQHHQYHRCWRHHHHHYHHRHHQICQAVVKISTATERRALHMPEIKIADTRLFGE